jgi:hypothetical protein
LPLEIWLALCLGFSIIVRTKPVALLVATLAGYVFIPFAAVSSFVHVPAHVLALNPFAWLLIVYFIYTAVFVSLPKGNAPASGREVSFHIPVLSMFLLIFAIAMIILQCLSYQNQGLLDVANQIVCPLLAIPILRRAVNLDPDSPPLLARWVVYIGMVEAGLVLLIKLHLIHQLFNSSFLSAYSWYPPGGRSLGTMDHPEVLGLFSMACIALVPNLRGSVRQLTATLLLFASLVLAAERLPLAIAILILMVSFFRKSSASRGSKKAIAAFVMLSVITVIGASSVLSLVYARVANDGGSTAARTLSWYTGASVVTHYPLTGVGVSGVTAVAKSLLEISFESPFFVFGIAFGLLPTVLLFISQASIALSGSPRKRAVVGSVVGVFAVLVYVQLFSSITVETAAGPIAGLMIALAMCREEEVSPLEIMTGGDISKMIDSPKGDFYFEWPSGSLRL